MNLIDEIRHAWGWVGLDPVEVVGENDFGNLIVRDVEAKYWRLCPEDCYCRVVAIDRKGLDTLSSDQHFLRDWHARALVEFAIDKCGHLPEGKKYCLKIPSLLGGEYGGDNLAIASLVELIRISGDIAKQTQDLPDGAVVKLRIVD